FYVRSRAEENFPAVVSAVIDVAHFFADEVANHRAMDVPQNIRRKNKSPIQGNHGVDSLPAVILRNLAAKLRNFFRNSACGIRSGFRGAQIFSSITRIACRVSCVAANSAATNPRAQTIFLPLSSMGQPSRSHLLTRFSFNKRFSLWMP